MKPNLTRQIALLLFLYLILSPVCRAQEDAGLDRLHALDQQCEAARAKKLAPIRDQLAKQCEQEPRRGGNKAEECRLETSTYGDTFSGPKGAAIEGMFYDLPECVAAKDAWTAWEKNRPWKK